MSNILIVDDDEDIAKILKIVIREMNYNVESFTDSVDALNHFISNPQKFSLVITDLKMPNMNGIELVKKIREINNSTRVFINTANNFENYVKHDDIYLLKIDRIIQKPVDIDVLKNMIYEVLN